VWDLKYRPLKFSDVLGQEGAVEVLKARLRKGNALDSSYIFSGAHGSGKTTLARILARAMLCDNLTSDQEPCNECDNCVAILGDSSQAFHERDAASNGKVDDVRAIVDDLPFAVEGAAKQIHLFDEAHRMTAPGQDVLLKPIEEKLMVGIFCTTEPEKIRGAIRSRCEEHRIRKITREDIASRLRKILAAEQVEFEEDAILTVIDCSGGHVRDTLNRLEMISQKNGTISLEAVRDYLGLSLTTTYYDILLSLDNPGVAIPLLEEACDRVGAEEVASGVAEAAMNAYRLHHKMFAEFAYVDRAKAELLYAKYGNGVVGYAKKFLGSQDQARTKVSLIFDVVSLTTQVDLPKISVALPPPLPVHSVTASAPQALALAPIGGKGNLGQDSLALTSLDKYGVPGVHPRGHAETPQKVVSAVEKDKALTPADWKRTFERSWRG
jgi:DNA polymerase III subunit gamma/tau